MTGSFRFDQMDGYVPPAPLPPPLSYRDMGEDDTAVVSEQGQPVPAAETPSTQEA